MGLLNWLFGRRKTTRSAEDQDDEEVREPSHGFRWYFFSVGSAMGPEVFRAIHKDDDFMTLRSTGLGRGLSDAKLRVRLYLSTSTSNSPSKDKGTFEGFELAKSKPSKPITVMAEAYNILAGVGGKAITVVLADTRYNDFYSAFRDYLNSRYIESGGLPIVTLLYTDAGQMAETLCGYFTLQEEGTPVLATGRKVDFFHPK